MDVKTIVESLGLDVFCCKDMLDRPVDGGYSGDLLSDVMANARKDNVWVTRQVHQNTVAVATLKELSAVIVVQGARPDADTLSKAVKEGIPILGSKLSAFEVTGRIFKLLGAS
ncbi:MAG TPA: serine kinase [Desulfomonilia bacterium]